MDYLFALCQQYIPSENIVTHAQSHPWLDDLCQRAIKKKADAEDSEAYAQEQARCAEVLKTAHTRYIAKLKIRIRQLSKSEQLC